MDLSILAGTICQMANASSCTNFSNFPADISGNGNECPLHINYLLIYFTCDVNMTSLSRTARVAQLRAVGDWWRSWTMANTLACLCSDIHHNPAVDKWYHKPNFKTCQKLILSPNTSQQITSKSNRFLPFQYVPLSKISPKFTHSFSEWPIATDKSANTRWHL